MSDTSNYGANQSQQKREGNLDLAAIELEIERIQSKYPHLKKYQSDLQSQEAAITDRPARRHICQVKSHDTLDMPKSFIQQNQRY